jgi:hypothetical protein
MRRIITTALAAAALMATTACATGSAQPYSNQVAPKKDEIALHVTNNNFGAITVRALSGGQDFYLGTVETDRKATFEVPPSFNHADLRFEAIVIDTGETFVSQQLSVSVGSVLNMNVAQELPLSNVVVAP